jgi:hypothetical protein
LQTFAALHGILHHIGSIHSPIHQFYPSIIRTSTNRTDSGWPPLQ